MRKFQSLLLVLKPLYDLDECTFNIEETKDTGQDQRTDS